MFVYSLPTDPLVPVLKHVNVIVAGVPLRNASSDAATCGLNLASNVDKVFVLTTSLSGGQQ